MQHAGVAITVTSVTDVLAFGVGAITVSDKYVLEMSQFFYSILQMLFDLSSNLVTQETRFLTGFITL